MKLFIIAAVLITSIVFPYETMALTIDTESSEANIDFKHNLSTLMKIDQSKYDKYNHVKKIIQKKGHNYLVCKELAVKTKKNGTKVRRIKRTKYNRHGQIVKKSRRIVFIDKNGNKTFKGPFSISEIATDDANKLTIELDSKDIKDGIKEKFTPHTVKYKIFTPEENFKDRKNKITADLYDVDGKKRFDVDLSTLAEGEYQLFVKIISNKTVHLERRAARIAKGKKPSKKPLINFVHVAAIDFLRSIPQTAHADLAVIQLDEFKSRVLFDMSGSYSELGDIAKYIVKLIKTGRR